MAPPTLDVVGEKFLPSRCHPGTLSYCPSMDLIAVVTVLDLPGDDAKTEQKLGVWRLNGQQVFGWDAPAGLAIQFVKWKKDGRLLALGTSDGAIRLLNVMNAGKMVHYLYSPPVESTLRPGLSCLAWAANFGDVKGMKDLLEEKAKGSALDELFSLDFGKKAVGKIKADLPRELACGVDVETSIPKLSALPPGTGARGGWGFGSGDDDVFSTRASMDAIFHSYSSTSNRPSRYDEVDVLLTGFEDGTIHIRIFDCFDIGRVDLTSSLPKDSKTCKVLRHVAHPLSSTHALVVQTTTRKAAYQLHVIALDLKFIPQTSPYYLSTLATKSTQLLNLLRYLTQVSTHLSIELRGAFDLPGKFVRNINETLAQNADGQTDFVTVAYQLAVTGDCGDELRNWMIDEVGERNLKRWDKASTLGMENIRRFTHECLLPALERCQVVISRLEGLSRFTKSAQVLGLGLQSLDRVMDTVDCLNLLGHYLLKTVGKEIKQFTAFMKWLRLEVEIQGLERENAGGPGSERLDELCMRRDDLDVRTVLDYIQGVMGKSAMVAFVRPSVDARGTSLEGPSYDWSHNQADVGFYEVFKKMLKINLGPGKRPDLDDLLRRLTGQAEKVFDGIAQTLRKSVLHGRVCTLQQDCNPDTMTARMALKSEGQHEVVFATTNRTEANHISLHHIPWEPAHPSQVPRVKEFTVPHNESAQGIQFVDDSDLMVLSSGQENAHLYTLSYASLDVVWQERHVFELSGGAEAPLELEVNGRKGRRAACVLEDGIKFTVFDLDSRQPDEEMPPRDEDIMIE